MQLDSEVVRLEGGLVVIVVKGRLTLGTRLSLLEAQLNTLVRDGEHKLILDLAQVDYCDSAGLGVMLHVAGAMKAGGGQFVLAAPNETLQKLFTLTNTAQLLNVAPSREAAIQQLH